MIRAMLYRPANGSTDSGGQELIDHWREDPRALIWVDLVDNELDRERQLMEEFGLHPLAIQDAQRQRHPPKIEPFDDHVFILLKGLGADVEGLEFETVQIAMFVGERFFVTRRSGDSPSTDRLWSEALSDPQRFAAGPDVLALRLSRIMVGRYLKLVLSLEPRLEAMEKAMVESPDDDMLADLIGYKADLKRFRRVFAYHVQIFRALTTESYPGINADHAHLVNDVYEQQERANSLASLYYELASDLIEGYISLASHRLNHIIKILTIITAVFVPLSFIAGLYGMNFENMPELHTRWGYFFILGFMAFVATILLFVFRRKNWF